MDGEIRELVVAIINEGSNEGTVNYVLTSIIDSIYGGGGYAVFNKAMGVLSCVQHEIYRRRISVYEDLKKVENGDVFK